MASKVFFIIIQFFFLVHSKFAKDIQGYFPNGTVTNADAFNFKFPVAPHFRVIAEVWLPHTSIQMEKDGTVKTRGPMGELMKLLAESVNFTYEVITGDGFWGAPQHDGAWNGMMGYLVRKDVIIALGPFGVSDLRRQAVDFTVAIFQESISVLVIRPQPKSDPLAFLSPFGFSIWMGIVVIFFVIASLKFVFRMREETTPHLDEHFWQTFSITMCQYTNINTTKSSSRLLIAVWMLVVVIFVRGYSGSLTSLLAVKNVPIKFDSLRDVINDEAVTIVREGSTTFTAYLPNAVEGVYKELYDKTQGRTILKTAAGLSEFAKKELHLGNNALLLETMTCNNIYSDDFSETGECKFYKGRVSFWSQPFSIAIPKGSPLKEIFDSRIHAIHAAGLYDRWVLEQMPNMTSCIRMPTRLILHQPYKMTDLWVVFALLGSGLLISAVAFCFEILVHKRVAMSH